MEDQNERHEPDRLQRSFMSRRRLALRKLRVHFTPPVDDEPDWPKVSESHVKHLLRVLWDHCDKGNRCWLKLQTIADEMQTSTRTVESAIAAAVRLEFVATEKWNRFTKATQYIIRWTEIFEYVFGPAAELGGGAGEENQSATVADCLDESTRNSCGLISEQPATVAGCLEQSIRNSCGLFSLHIRNEDFKEEGLEDNPPPPEETSGGEVEEVFDSLSLKEQWREVERRAADHIFDLSCIATARDRGCTPAEILELLEFGAANADRWESPGGAISHRIRNAVPGQPADQRWSEPRKTPNRQSHTAQRQNAQENAQSARARRDDGIARRELERTYGPILDAMPAADRDRLALDVLKAGTPAYLAFRRDPAGPMVRDKLLRTLRDRAALSTGGLP